ncbi:MAG TPA: pilus assembly protein [Candidatus Pelethosoma merdigallinarum]|nr:pilus assembly protein [Candidatus Pelethosoma merdigallinarum]
MKMNKGQALVEFIIILPVALLLVLGVIDFGNIIYKKYTLENDLDTVVDLYQNDQAQAMNDYVTKNNLSLNIDSGEEYVTVSISKRVRVYTPGLGQIINNPFSIETKRVIYNGS